MYRVFVRLACEQNNVHVYLSYVIKSGLFLSLTTISMAHTGSLGANFTTRAIIVVLTSVDFHLAQCQWVK